MIEVLGETGAEVVFVCREVRSRTDIVTGQSRCRSGHGSWRFSVSLRAAQRAVLGRPPPVSNGSHVQPGNHRRDTRHSGQCSLGDAEGVLVALRHCSLDEAYIELVQRPNGTVWPWDGHVARDVDDRINRGDLDRIGFGKHAEIVGSPPGCRNPPVHPDDVKER